MERATITGRILLFWIRSSSRSPITVQARPQRINNNRGRRIELLAGHGTITMNSAELSLLQGQCFLAVQAKADAAETLRQSLVLMGGAFPWHPALTREEIEKLPAELNDKKGFAQCGPVGRERRTAAERNQSSIAMGSTGMGKKR